MTYHDAAGPLIYLFLVAATICLGLAMSRRDWTTWWAARLTDVGSGFAVLALFALVAALVIPE